MSLTILKITLYINAVSSAAIGAVLALFSTPVTALLGNFPAWITLVIGVGLVIFGFAVFAVARGLPASSGYVKTIFIADVAWVTATPVVLVAFAEQLSLWGNLVLLAVGLVVAVYAVLEWRGMHVMQTRA